EGDWGTLAGEGECLREPSPEWEGGAEVRRGFTGGMPLRGSEAQTSGCLAYSVNPFYVASRSQPRADGPGGHMRCTVRACSPVCLCSRHPTVTCWGAVKSNSRTELLPRCHFRTAMVASA